MSEEKKNQQTGRTFRDVYECKADGTNSASSTEKSVKVETTSQGVSLSEKCMPQQDRGEEMQKIHYDEIDVNHISRLEVH